MKKTIKAGLPMLFCLLITALMIYFKWAAQDTTSLPGLPKLHTNSIFEILQNNTDLAIVSLIGSIPIFYISMFFLTPTLLSRRSYSTFALYVAVLTAYYYAVILITDFIFPMYYFFGTPYAIKVLIPIILISGFGGSLFAWSEKHHAKNV